MKVEPLASYIAAQTYYPQKINKDEEIIGLAALSSAQRGELSFFVDASYKEELKKTKASAVILSKKVEDLDLIQIIHPNPRLAIASLSQKFYPKSHSLSQQHPLAHIHKTATVHESSTVYPFAFIDKEATIGRNCVIYSGSHIGHNCQIGDNTTIYPNCVIMEHTIIGQNVIVHGGAVLGSDGFGFVPTQDENIKVPQVGHVVIEDHVEIGALCTIDRATFDTTIIRKGAKLDSQVHIGHNVDIGELSLICGQTGFAGCAKVGKRFIASGQSAIGPSVTIGANVTVGPKTGVIQDQKESGEYMGMPTLKKSKWIRQQLSSAKVPKLLSEFQSLKLKVKKLEETLEKLCST